MLFIGKICLYVVHWLDGLCVYMLCIGKMRICVYMLIKGMMDVLVS